MAVVAVPGSATAVADPPPDFVVVPVFGAACGVALCVSSELVRVPFFEVRVVVDLEDFVCLAILLILLLGPIANLGRGVS